MYDCQKLFIFFWLYYMYVQQGAPHTHMEKTVTLSVASVWMVSRVAGRQGCVLKAANKAITEVQMVCCGKYDAC